MSMEIRLDPFQMDGEAPAPYGGKGRVRPTLLIGLGGSGKEVLMRLRRMYYERNRMPGLPIMGYLWFDTDVRAGGIGGRPWDAIDELVQFDQSEKHDVSISRDRTNQMWRSPGENAHLESWLEWEKLKGPAGLGITDGAKAIRPFGRLAFYENFPTIRKALSDKVLSITGTTSINAVRNMPVDPTLEVVIISSLAGGTGSGCFLDFGFLAKHLFPNALHTGIFFLPQVFEGLGNLNREEIFANGYAALMELNHYLLPRSELIDSKEGKKSSRHGFLKDTSSYRFREWEFWWEPQGSTKVAAPPFDVNYLVDRVNFNGRHSGDYLDSFQMVAESLLLDFEGSPLADDKRSFRSNAQAKLSQRVAYTYSSSADSSGGQYPKYMEHFPARFSSFGLSQIQVNSSRMANAAGFLLGQKLLGFLLKENQVSGWDYDWSSQQLTTQQAREIIALRQDGRSFAVVEVENMERELTSGVLQEAEQLYQRLKVRGGGLAQEEALDFFQEIEGVLLRIHNPDWQPRPTDKKAQTVQEARDRVLEVFPKAFGLLGQTARDAVARIQVTLKKQLERLGVDGMNDGTDTLAFRENRQNYEEGRREAVQAQVMEYICDPVRRGVSYMDRYLQELEITLKGLLAEVGPQRTQVVEEVKFTATNLESFERPDASHLEELERMLAEVRHLPVFPLNPFPRRLARGYYQTALQEASKRWEDEFTRSLLLYLESFLGHLLDELHRVKQALRSAIEAIYERRFAEDFTQAVGALLDQQLDLSQRMESFRSSLLEVQREFDSLFNAFTRPLDSVRNHFIDLGWSEAEYLVALTGHFRLVHGDPLDSLYTQLWRQEFFLEAVPPLVNSDLDAGQAYRQGMQVLFERSAQGRGASREWRELVTALRSFCLRRLEGFRGLAQGESVSQRLTAMAATNPKEVKRILDNAVQNAAARIRKSTYGESKFQIHVDRVLGIHDPSDPLVTVLHMGRNENIKDLNLDKEFEGEARTYDEDSIILYEEKTAFPLFYAGGGQTPGGLEDLRKSYHNNCLHLNSAAEVVYMRHSLKDYNTLRDILPPTHGKEIEEISQNYEPFLLAVALGIISYSPTIGFHRIWQEKGRQRTVIFGSSLLKAVQVHKAKEVQQLTPLNQETIESWRQENNGRGKLIALLALLVYWRNWVFTDTRDLIHLAVDKMLIERFDRTQAALGIRESTELEEEVGAMLGSSSRGGDPILNNDLTNLNSFSVTIAYNDENLNHELRVLPRLERPAPRPDAKPEPPRSWGF